MDVFAANWTEDDSSNSTPAPDGWPEGMAASGVNNAGRAMMGATKRLTSWLHPKTTGGSGTAFTLSYTVAPGALVDTMSHLVQFHAANGLAPTLNVNNLGATPLHYYSAGAWRTIPTGLIDANETWRVAYNSSAGAYRLLDLRNRTGEVASFAGTTAPTGTLLCYGQAISRTDYVGLFTVIGTTYGVGDGTTTFNLPDLRGRVAAGKDNMGGSAASRLTSGTMSPDGVTLGATGGAQIHNHTGIVSTPTGAAALIPTTAPDSSVATNNHQHTITADSSLQPTIILNYIIRI